MVRYRKIYLPCNSEKVPTILNWQNLKESFPRRNKNETLSGLLTGKRAGFFVVDTDFYKGEKIYEELEEKYWEYLKEETYTVRTPNGGNHYYFNYEECFDRNSRNEEYNLDIRSSGGMVIAPPSKNYEENEKKIINIPERLKIFLLEKIVSHECELPKNNIKIKGEKIKVLIEKLPKSKNNTEAYDDNRWHTITNILFTYEMKEYWDEWSKKSLTKYNKKKNEKIWKNQVKYKTSPLKLFYMNKNEKKKCFYKTEEEMFVNNDKKEINMRYINGILKSGKNYLIKSDPGTGKTTEFINYIKKRKYISIVSRKSLARDHYERLPNGKVYYNEKLLEYGDNIIISIDSLLKIKELEYDEYIIFIDEFNSVLEHLINSETYVKQNRIEIYNLFIKIIKSGKQIIAMDADINYISHGFLCMILKNKLEYIENSYKNFEGKIVYIHNNENELIELIKNTDKFMIASDSATKIRLLNHKIEFTRIIRENGLDTEQEDNEELNLNLDEIDRVGFSPKIIYGLDSKIERKVFGFYQGHTISPSQMVQQIGRCRNPVEIHLYFNNKDNSKVPEYENLDECVKKNIGKLLELNKINGIKINGKEDNYNTFKCMFDYQNDIYNTNKYYHLIDLLRKRGYNVIENCKKENKIDWTELKDREKNMTKEKFMSLLEENNLPEWIKMRNQKLKIPRDSLADYWEFLTYEEEYRRVEIYKKLCEGKMVGDNFIGDYQINKICNIPNKINFVLEGLKILGINKLENLDKFECEGVNNENYIELEKKYRLISRTTKLNLDFKNPKVFYNAVCNVLRGLIGDVIESKNVKIKNNVMKINFIKKDNILDKIKCFSLIEFID